MKRILGTLLLCVSIASLSATSYYVRTDGSDSNDGLANTSGGAWLTMGKALGSSGVPLTGGPHTLNVGAGAYVSTTFLNLNRAYGTLTTVQPTSGSMDVFISGQSNTWNVLQQGAIANLKFYKITFLSGPGTTKGVYLYPGSGNTVTNLTFDSCVMSNTVCTSDFFGTESGGANPAQRLTITNCSIYSATAGCIRLGSSATNTVLEIYDTTSVSYSGSGVAIDGGTLIGTHSTFASCGLVSSGNYGVRVGQDAATGTWCTGALTNCTVRSLSGHAFLIGAGSDGFALNSSVIHGGNLGLVLKMSKNCIVSSNVVYAGTDSALLFKGAKSTIVTNNMFIGNGSILIQPNTVANYDGAVGYTNINCTFTGNQVWGPSTAVLYWRGESDGGGNLVDYNVYGRWGLNAGTKFSVLFLSIQTNFPAMRAAWSANGYPNNDQHSRDVSLPIPVAIPFAQ